MRFEPVYLPEDRWTPGRASQTFLRHYNGCPRSGYLYQLHRGEASTVEMVRGTALHEVLARANHLMIRQGESTIPGEVVKDLVNEVLGEHPVPLEEHDYIREMSYRWAEQTAITPEAAVAVETLFALDLNGVQVRCKIDYAESDGETVYVADYKSSRYAPPFEEIARKRPDGTLMAKNFQLVLYALVLAYGVPVYEDEAEGHRIEVPADLGVAHNAQSFELEFVYPGIKDSAGMMVRRQMTLTKTELVEYRASLEALLKRLAASEETGDWPAVVSDSACGQCPAPLECPIPVEMRDLRGVIQTPAEAARAAELLEVQGKAHDALRKEIKAFAKDQGIAIRYGRDKVFEFTFQESTRLQNREALASTVEAAITSGVPVEWELFFKTVQSTPFKARTLTQDELEAEDVGGPGEGTGSEGAPEGQDAA